MISGAGRANRQRLLLEDDNGVVVAGVSRPEHRGCVVQPSRLQVVPCRDAFDGLTEVGFESTRRVDIAGRRSPRVPEHPGSANHQHLGGRAQQRGSTASSSKSAASSSRVLSSPGGMVGQRAERNSAERPRKTLRRRKGSGVVASAAASIRGVAGGDHGSRRAPTAARPPRTGEAPFVGELPPLGLRESGREVCQCESGDRRSHRRLPPDGARPSRRSRAAGSSRSSVDHVVIDRRGQLCKRATGVLWLDLEAELAACGPEKAFEHAECRIVLTLLDRDTVDVDTPAFAAEVPVARGQLRSEPPAAGFRR